MKLNSTQNQGANKMETQEVFTREEFGDDESLVPAENQNLWYGPVRPEDLVKVRVHNSFIENGYHSSVKRVPSWNPTRGNNRQGITFYTTEFGLLRLADHLDHDIEYYTECETPYETAFNTNELNKSLRTLVKIDKLLEEKFDYEIG